MNNLRWYGALKHKRRNPDITLPPTRRILRSAVLDPNDATG
jgi:hypothetical protein